MTEFLTCGDEETGGHVPRTATRRGGGTARNAADHGPAPPPHAPHARAPAKAQVRPLVDGKSD
ncbi:hypothetical protein LUW76_06920 [Actinomadura madurae]|uniref:hypothetical protein n=1 Tax=Actinomadura madurae TaxID=1993 RepID=UPI002026D14A|nr:hypothetical protein [Actinomadura madurae]URM94081.1 hypothetical protein LUW76_06920 [Actinomadura madurae]URN04788.1 hypothetical protein LUW74_16645 [Actinomadura madurae]